jgi:hypothetical protein
MYNFWSGNDDEMDDFIPEKPGPELKDWLERLGLQRIPIPAPSRPHRLRYIDDTDHVGALPEGFHGRWDELTPDDIKFLLDLKVAVFDEEGK